MKFLCDVHISYKLAKHLKSIGFDTIHINEILNKSETKDSDICQYADQHDFILITKDSDFRDTYFIKKTPKKLIKINLGNISNDELIHIISSHISAIDKIKTEPYFLIEIDKDEISLIESPNSA
jgi:predicted nuclease of predicted toxin-antitoxin system